MGRSLVLLALLAFAMAMPQASGGASSAVTLTVAVPSATNLDASGCATGAGGATSFGTVLPGTSSVSTVDCTLEWGSSNDTAMLRVYQQDGFGGAMVQMPTGQLDASFGTGGVVREADPAGGHDGEHAVALQADGKLLVGGLFIAAGDTAREAFLYRYTDSGTLDPSFDGDGRVRTPSLFRIHEIIVQPDGKIIVAGMSGWYGSFDFAAARYNTDGSLDAGFGTGGTISTSFGAGEDRGIAATLQPDGKLVVGGYASNGADDDIALVRYTAAGALDSDFGSGGKIIAAIGTGNDRGSDVKLQPDGRIVVSATYATGVNDDIAVLRFNSDGTLDGTFSGDGMATTPIGAGNDTAAAVVIQTDGNILVAGDAVSVSQDFAVVRFTPLGALDTAFDTDGIVIIPTDTYSDLATNVLVQPDGRIVLTGTGLGFQTARLTPTGSLDPSFDGDGIHRATIPTGDDNRSYDSTFADGKLVLVGMSYTAADGFQIGMVRYDAAMLVDYAGGSSDWTAGSNMFGACLRAISGTGVTATWTTNSTCDPSNGAHWNAVPARGGTAGSKIAASTTATTAGAIANLRFGLRTASNQAPGTYLAGLAFEVVAPNA